MNRRTRQALAACAFAAGAAGCSDFLTGSNLSNDPNNPTIGSLTPSNLLIGITSAQSSRYGGTLAYTICIWMQQCEGTGGRFVESQGEQYNIDPTTFTLDWTLSYTGGGLLDIRRLQQIASQGATPNLLQRGVARVWEAIVVGDAADQFGDIPYRQAADSTVRAPQFDNQLEVYAAIVDSVLPAAITDLQSGQGAIAGDAVYGGDAEKWIRLANTLRARYLLHTVEVRPGGVSSANPDYARIAQFAAAGLASRADDFNANFSGSSQGQSNPWFQFLTGSGFGNDIRAGTTLVQLMRQRNDPRLATYFGSADVEGGEELTGPRFVANFPQPRVSYTENLLIQAEAALFTGGPAAAQPFLDQARVNEGLTTAQLPAGEQPATLRNIITEKYISLFQNWEVWNDWKRTCLPPLTARTGPGVSAIFGGIPRRIYYADNEVNTNPNTPTTGQIVAQNGGFRNRNDTGPCPTTP